MKVRMDDFEQLSEDYHRVEQAIHYVEANYRKQPELEEIAASLGLSEYHFQRIFSRWVGISPKRFLQYITKENAKRLLEEHHSLLDVAVETGLSGPGRLHDLFISTEAVTPGEYKARGDGLVIRYGFHPTPFGECLLAATPRGVCNLVFVEHGGRDAAAGLLRGAWGQAEIVEDPGHTAPLVEQVFSFLRGGGHEPLHLHLQGTNFQIKVWEALLRIPPGEVVTYEDIAAALGMPRSSRAVGNAVGRNPLPVLIPCHRVIRKDGEFGNYRYGPARKKALLAWESAGSEV